MPTSKIDHKELQKRLKEDELSLYFEEWTQWIRFVFNTYGKSLLFGIAIILLLAIAVYLWVMKNRTDHNSAQLYFGNASAFMQDDNYEQALQDLGKLLSDYPRSELTASAHILHGVCLFKTDQFEKAKSELETVLPQLQGDDTLFVKITLVQIERSLNHTDQALALLDSIASSQITDALKDQIHYLKGGCYEDQQENEKALAEYHAIDSKSSWYPLVREKIEWLEAPLVAPINP